MKGSVWGQPTDSFVWKDISQLRVLVFWVSPGGEGDVFFTHRPSFIGHSIPFSNVSKTTPRQVQLDEKVVCSWSYFATHGNITFDEGATLAASMLE